ncbi:hypothetical protein Poly59_18700 [Rubripirellula reticaptiva]|uniref:Uncharacterized protein n=1 Tax=Rubripirellula reticaptiva TaxID=2528013 RepID=A0A5C6F4Y3_9BACT|nr:hypothetical protein Poly59_18700 [Rubripirellula reticaptiva]
MWSVGIDELETIVDAERDRDKGNCASSRLGPNQRRSDFFDLIRGI